MSAKGYTIHHENHETLYRQFQRSHRAPSQSTLAFGRSREQLRPSHCAATTAYKSEASVHNVMHLGRHNTHGQDEGFNRQHMLNISDPVDIKRNVWCDGGIVDKNAIHRLSCDVSTVAACQTSLGMFGVITRVQRVYNNTLILPGAKKNS